MSFLSKNIEYYKGTTFDKELVKLSETDVTNFGTSGYSYRSQIKPDRRSSLLWSDITNEYFYVNAENNLSVSVPGNIFEKIPEGIWEMDLFLYDNTTSTEIRKLLCFYKISIIQNVTQISYGEISPKPPVHTLPYTLPFELA